MEKLSAALVLITAFLATSPVASQRALAASFDCRHDTGPAEKTICNHFGLSSMDEEMAYVYFQLTDDLGRQAARTRLDSQRAWLRYRDDSGTNEKCLFMLYRNRIKRLKSDQQDWLASRDSAREYHRSDENNYSESRAGCPSDLSKEYVAIEPTRDDWRKVFIVWSARIYSGGRFDWANHTELWVCDILKDTPVQKPVRVLALKCEGDQKPVQATLTVTKSGSDHSVLVKFLHPAMPANDIHETRMVEIAVALS